MLFGLMCLFKINIVNLCINDYVWIVVVNCCLFVVLVLEVFCIFLSKSVDGVLGLNGFFSFIVDGSVE